MTEHTGGRLQEAPHKATCRVCLKPFGPDEKKWTVHHRGAEYQVCCPSCVQLFNRAPRQYMEEP